MDQSLENIKIKYLKKISEINSSQELEQIRVEILGRNGEINKLFARPMI